MIALSNTKRCKQCGILKQAEDFRKYTYSKAKDTEGRYTLCKACESINSRYKVLRTRLASEPTNGASTDQVEYDKIDNLYKALETRGLKTPLSFAKSKPTVSPVDQIFQFYGVPEKPATQQQPYEKKAMQAPKIPTAPEVQDVVPSDLQTWLDGTMESWNEHELSPEFLQETIYESLKATYRPQIGVDPDTYMPIYDDTYKDMLNAILRRFDEYEEIYAGSSEDAE